uniref:Synaptobrevin, longin-like domain protein n=1 Tax=Tanacetum cinerariifolium TaxID=118510 RepID=A0A699GXP5_TANCI|nr:synaptobrevin, longin-like domain protein [Tanacetum cinerariifolium]
MIAILEKYEHNIDFHQIVDFVEASYLRYALTINPTIYVSHIRQFWSAARVKTSDEETKILATVDGKPRTIFESSISRYLKLRDETGISSLPDAELFENLTLMGYNILPNQKFSFQKGQFSHQWKYLIHTIMQCLSPKSTGFNEFNSNIATALVCLATNRVYNFSKMILDGRTVPLFPTMLVTMGEGSGTPTEPHHTPTPEATPSLQHELSSSSLPPVSTATIPTVIPTETPPLRQYTRRARIAQSLALLTVADELASPLGDDSQGKACPTVSGFEAEHDKANITKTSTLSSDLTPMVTSFAADEGSMQHKLTELTDLIKHLEDRDGGYDDPSGEDATIKGRRLETGEEVEVVTVSIPLAGEIPIVSVPTGSGVVPTASPIFTTATVTTPYLRRKELPIGERIELINDLVKYQDNYAKVIKYQTQQRKTLSKKQQREFYMSVLRSHAGWKTKHFKGMSLEEIKEKFVPVWKQIEDFIPIEEVSEEDLKAMMQLFPVEEVYVEALQIWALVKETLNIKQATSNKEKELWVELKRLYEPDVEDQLWTQTQALMHDPVEWRLYNSCDVHHILLRDQEIFMLVEREYPLRKGLTIVMISNKLQVENYSQMASDLIQKIYEIANSPRQRSD